ncbi:hypothetical protein PCANC_15131 [Puccinia coronata f. sp. avenae]|uniref:Uncharacterized protein n=2 Tax=Puccinia coronata f. sp. avenae TaxID=200324 RepID=A0A2N5SML4_9BASI|nr:hypothetical protein PCANC_15131 [Puccinia coronata f. sp. avenae]
MAAKSTDSEKQLFAIQFGPDPALTGSIPKPRLDLKVQAIKTVVTCSVSLREKPSGSAKFSILFLLNSFEFCLRELLYERAFLINASESVQLSPRLYSKFLVRSTRFDPSTAIYSLCYHRFESFSSLTKHPPKPVNFQPIHSSAPFTFAYPFYLQSPNMWTSLVKAAFGLTVAAQMVSSRIIVSRQEQCASATNDAEKGACDMKAAFGGSAIFAQLLPEFSPKAALYVKYGNVVVGGAQQMSPSKVATQPFLSLSFISNSSQVLQQAYIIIGVQYQPQAKTTSLFWLQSSVKINSNTGDMTSSVAPIVKYRSPNPPQSSGANEFIFLIFQDPGLDALLSQSTQLAAMISGTFDFATFVKTLQVSNAAIAGSFFKSTYDGIAISGIQASSASSVTSRVSNVSTTATGNTTSVASSNTATSVGRTANATTSTATNQTETDQNSTSSSAMTLSGQKQLKSFAVAVILGATML